MKEKKKKNATTKKVKMTFKEIPDESWAVTRKGRKEKMFFLSLL